jgi:O-antigen/teichoic acid export membrane protein
VEDTVPRSGTRADTQRGSVAGLAAWTYAATATGLVTGPIIARVLGPAGRGQIAAGQSISALATGLLALGMGLAVSRTVAQEPGRIPALLGSCLRFVGLISPVALVAAVVVPLFGLTDYPTSTRVVIGILIAITPLDIYSVCLQAVCRGLGRLRPLAHTRMLPLAVNLALVVVLALAGWLTVTAVLMGGIAATLLVVVYLSGSVGTRPKGALPLRPLVGFGLRGYPGSFAEFVSLRADQVLIALVLPPRQLGFYAVAVTVSLVPQGLARSLAPRAFGEVAKRDEVESIGTAESYLRLAGLTAFGSMALVAAAAPLVPLVYGEPFRGAVVPLLLLIPGTAGLVWSQVAGPVLTALGRPGRMSLARVVGFAVTVIALPLGVAQWGIRGAAVASSAAYLAQALAATIALWRLGVHRLRPGREDLALLVSRIARRRPS